MSFTEDKPRPILFAHSSDEMYGSDVVLLELVRRLDRTRFRPLVITPTDLQYEGLLSRALADAGVEHLALDMPILRRRHLSPARLPAFAGRLHRGPQHVEKIIRARRVALAHSNTAAVWGGALAARRAGVPHLWHVHEIITQPAWVRRLVAWMIARHSDHVVAISQAVADHLLADQPNLATRLSIIHDAVDATRFHPDVDGWALRSEWGVKREEVLVGVVGRISAWKGQDFFLKAFARASAHAPQLRAVFVGDVVPGEVWRREALREMAQNMGVATNIIWAGYRTDAPQVMAALDVLALPSIRPEPFGMVVVEAMAAGKPVVATAHGGPLETVLDRETGRLVSPRDPQEMAQALVELASRPELRKQWGANARRHVVQSFSFERHVTAFEALYAQLLEDSCANGR
ncbi:MAG: glycosyltransferase family 4 protein [Chloroflexi bacterium]|nr:glycosyltransferase family 4 protein [Chloroflexota bacterium]